MKAIWRSSRLRKALLLAIPAGLGAFLAGDVHSAGPMLPTITLGAAPASEPQQVSLALTILGLLTVLSLAPAILLLMTPFTRIVIVLAFLRQALGTQQIPPNQVLIGLAMFMTFFLMRPTGEAIYGQALDPYMKGRINFSQALKRGTTPIREFMFRHAQQRDLALFVFLAKSPRPKNPEDVSTLVLIPAFVISELRTAFTMGFILFIPFLVIDMVVASTLMAMGILMLPPITISLPFKILLFIMVDGWNLITRSLIESLGP